MIDYIIVGAGLFGSVFAQQATAHGKKCLVIDKRTHIAGNIYTKIDNNTGILKHVYGPHIFHTSDEIVWNYVNNYAKFSLFINSPIAIYKSEIYNLPFNMNTFNKLWGVVTPYEAKEYIKRNTVDFSTKRPKNLEEQAIALVGMELYTKLIKGYTEKQWGKPCNSLPASIINRLPLRFNYDNNYFCDTYQGIPKDGYTKMIQNMLTGIPVELETNYLEFAKHHSKLVKNAKKIIYTGKLDEYFNYCYGKLDYRSLKFEDKVLDMDNYQGVAVVNFTEKNIKQTRIIEHRHFDSKFHSSIDKTLISYEYPEEYRDENSEYPNDPYYPVNDKSNNCIAEQYKMLRKNVSPNVIFGGRLAEYKYYDMDKVIVSAIRAVKMEFGTLK
ncbi:MAG: UDP-galactopyranose mutase [Firmicutes bacterium]|nr:UDP-galactopyranose mutase [Bacillota bacterium]MCL1953931.1 UDP-galactopyranose mutase [Bacillota bacterium]